MKDKMKVRFVRLGLSLTALFVVLMIPLVYRNLNFRSFIGVPKGMVVGGTTNGFESGGWVQNVTHGNLEGRNISKSSKSGSLTTSTNDSPQHIGISHDKHKLLNGLLVDGFDKASCISRLDSHLYRKASPYSPSAYLIFKLRDYEEIHRRCGPNSENYIMDMRKIAESKNNSTTATMCKYIFWSPPDDGLGNRIVSLTSTFLYAILTNRVLLVEFGKDMLDLFCEPFLNSTWLLQENPNFKHVRRFQSIIDGDGDFPFPKPSVVIVDLKLKYTHPERYFQCDDSQEFLSKVPLLILESNEYFVPSLFMTPLFNKELNKMFPEIDTVFHHLGHYLFHPSNEAWILIRNFYQANLVNADEKIGLQIRVYDWSTTPQKVFMKQVLNCTIQNKLLPHVGMPLQSSVSSSENKQRVKAVLVASLSPKYGEDLRAIYMNKPTITEEVIKVYQPSGEEHQKLNDKEQNMKAWVEIYLLSLSDVLVTTYESTFGYVARSLGNSRAWILYHQNTSKAPFPACEREFLLEPCYHDSPKHYCDGKLIHDFTSSFPYIKHCKDYPSGVKLGNVSNSVYM